MIKFLRENQYYELWCTGCNKLHLIPDADGKPRWTFDGNFEKPTLSPSVKHTWNDKCCHYFIKSGKIEYCNDSTHSLAGKTVDMVEIPEDKYGFNE
jgi:hypothetical protein